MYYVIFLRYGFGNTNNSFILPFSRQVMAQENTKIVLLLFFSFGLVQTNLTNQSQKREKRYDFQSQGYQDALKDLAQWAQEVGPYRVCSAQRYSQFTACTKGQFLLW